jgi:transcriptional regulator of met regulon
MINKKGNLVIYILSESEKKTKKVFRVMQQFTVTAEMTVVKILGDQTSKRPVVALKRSLQPFIV